MRNVRRTLTVLIGCAALAGPAAAQTVELARQEVRQSDPVSPRPASSEPPSREDRPSSASDPSEEAAELGYYPALLLGVGAAVTSPVWAPKYLLDDNYRTPGYFPPHPYEKSRGSLVLATEPYEPLRPWSAQASLSYGDDFDGLARTAGQVLVSTTQRIDFDTEWNWYREDQPDGAESIHTGDFNVMFRCAQSVRAQLRIGLGLNWLVDEEDQDVGFNFTYGAQIFPIKPWVLAAELDWGTLGNAPLLHVRATAGLVFHGCELFTGYDYRSIGQADLMGPMVGLRYHF